MTTRREFIGAGAAILGASAAGASSMIKPADEKLDILLLLVCEATEKEGS